MTTRVSIPLGGTGSNNLTISVNTSSDAMRITQLGTGNAFVIEDETNPDSTPFLISNTGNVGIGISDPISYFHANVGSQRMILQTNSNSGTSPLNLWNSNTGNSVGSGMVFCAGGDGVTTGFIGGISSRKMDANNGRTVLRVFTANTITPIAAGYVPFYLDGANNSSLAHVVMDGNVFIGSTTGGFTTAQPNANLHVTGTIIDTPIVTITSNATFNENAAGRVIFANTTNNITVTVANGFSSGFTYTVIRGNTGNVTIANSNVRRLNSASYTSMNIVQYGAATIVYVATDQVMVFGDFT